MIKKTVLFLVLNFAALAIGGFFTGDGVTSEWYQNLNKAPWTPPGWVFGAAWTTIMICFSIYLLYFFTKKYTRKKLLLFIIQVLLNVSWNYIFFNQQQVLIALIIITLLTALIFYIFLSYLKEQKKVSYLLLPYMIWLCIATSLNLYILIHN